MTDFSKFYRIIGIAEHIIEPSYYHLLGLDMNNCTPETVRAALIAKKKELRENIPGQEFVPMVLKFEREQLEPAAEVLADDQKRARYNKELTEKWKQIKQENEKRGVMLEAVRNTVANALDENGTLDSEGRQELADVLEALGVEKHNVDIILDRIPRPLSETGHKPAMNKEFFDTSVQLAIDEGSVDKAQHQRFIDLAKMLNVDVEDNSRIFSQDDQDENADAKIILDDDGVDSIGAVLEDEYDENLLKLIEEPGQNDQQGQIRFVESVTDGNDETKPEPSELTDAEAKMMLEAKGTQPHQKNHGKWFALLVVPVIIAILAGLLFLLFAVLKNIDLGGTGSRLEQEIAETENTTTENPKTSGPRSGGDAESVDNTNTVGNTNTVDNTNLPINTGSVDDINPVDISLTQTLPDAAVIVDPNKDQPQRPYEKLSDVLSDLAARDFKRQKKHELLADSVLGMLAISERAAVLSGKPNKPAAELKAVLDTPFSKRPAMFAEAEIERTVQKEFFDNHFGPVPAVDEDELNKIYAKLKNDLESSDRDVRYKAVDRLQADGSKQAIEILLGPKDNPFVGSKATVSKRLRALSKIRSNHIAREIAVRLGNSPRPAVAQQLSLALYDMTGIVAQNAGIIGAKNDYQSRLRCSEWWLDALNEWQPQGTESIEHLFDDRLVNEIILPDTLVSALTHYTTTAAQQLTEEPEADSNDLAGISWDSLVIKDSNSITGDVSSSVLFQKAAAGLYNELERIIRENRRSKNYLVEVDVIKLERDAVRLINDNGLQKAAVDMWAAGRLLDVLVRLDTPGTGNEKLLEMISRDRLKDKQESANVLQEIRQQIYHNIRLFELLTSERNDRWIK